MSASAKPSVQTIPVYLTLGSNIEPEHNLPRAIELLSETHPVLRASSVWETPPVAAGGANFLNAAVLIRTYLEMEQLKFGVLREIEARLGRVRTADKNAPRPIDLDIAIYDRRVIEEDIWTQPHLAVPLGEIAGDLRQPGTGITLQSLAGRFLASGVLTQRPEISLLAPR